MHALGLQIDSESEGKVSLFPIVYIISNWLVFKIRKLSYTTKWLENGNERLKSIILKCANATGIALKVTSFSNLIYFFVNGEFPSLVHRLANIKMSPSNALRSDTGGHKRGHLFIESRKMMWYALLGLSSALAVAIDWKGLQLGFFMLVHSIMRSIRRGDSISARVTRIFRTYLQSISQAHTSIGGAIGAAIRAMRARFSRSEGTSSSSPASEADLASSSSVHAHGNTSGENNDDGENISIDEEGRGEGRSVPIPAPIPLVREGDADADEGRGGRDGRGDGDGGDRQTKDTCVLCSLKPVEVSIVEWSRESRIE